ncbi:MAG: DNA adenine methylase [Treponema sp.]|nr:DNA adenine methylase [Treponema sp.]
MAAASENNEYLTKQLITYIGNKRALLDFIGEGVKKVRNKLQKDKLKIFDVFSGSGITARYFKQFSELLIVNDLEKYSKVINECYLSNECEMDIIALREKFRDLTEKISSEMQNFAKRRSDSGKNGIIAELYSPADDDNIKSGERVFFTRRNAVYIDAARKIIETLPYNTRNFFLAPLLSEASIHANTSGVFKGFYKNAETGIGQFGGKKRDALSRIKGDISLPFPVFSNFNCDTVICNGDSNKIIYELPDVDLAYIDPPYNQHPYGSNYFMLNLIADYVKPKNISRVSGIPDNWNRSDYNRKAHAYNLFKKLAEDIKAKYLLISFNSEGFIKNDEMANLLKKIGKLEILEIKYNTFKGSRNLNNREIHIKEYLYLLEK